MDPATALKAVRAKGKPGEVLVSFFGDNSYGWFEASSLMPFKANYVQSSSVHASKAKVRGGVWVGHEQC
jgi:DNA (cytosine-5)-methyltransferase 3A